MLRFINWFLSLTCPFSFTFSLLRCNLDWHKQLATSVLSAFDTVQLPDKQLHVKWKFNAILTICMWRGSIIDLLNDWYKCRLHLQGITLTSLAWCLFSSQLQSPFVPEEWSKQHETTNKLVGCLSTRFSTFPSHSLLARSGIQWINPDPLREWQWWDLSLPYFPYCHE